METTNACLKNMPVSWFATIMGLSGCALAWRRAELLWQLPYGLSLPLQYIAAALFLFLSAFYLAKWMRYPEQARAEIHHPVKLAFLPTISISLVLLSTVFLPTAPTLSFWLWACGSFAHFMLTLAVMNIWLHHAPHPILQLNPAWFIPIVGNILVPIAGVAHGLQEISWFFFAYGLFFWPVLSALLFYRLIFHEPLPERLLPTLFIFIAPPAVGFISWHTLHGGSVDAFGRILYGVALFFALLLFSQAARFVRLRFFLSGWAYSFPLAALALASMIMAENTGHRLYHGLSAFLLVLLTVLIA
ncbi:MAG: SLAC1 anion channel family protein, partial [Rhodocyclaceae bacterium]|nr:SLAC1 anion channel family protein [Rhodocyclaceae bacterium]